MPTRLPHTFYRHITRVDLFRWGDMAHPRRRRSHDGRVARGATIRQSDRQIDKVCRLHATILNYLCSLVRTKIMRLSDPTSRQAQQIVVRITRRSSSWRFSAAGMLQHHLVRFPRSFPCTPAVPRGTVAVRTRCHHTAFQGNGEQPAV